MSFFSFNLIGNALDAFQTAESVTADNIANVATPGASRQTADIRQATPIVGSPFLPNHGGGPGTQGEGAVVQQITRIHQDSYDGLFRGASSSQWFYSTEQDQLNTLQSNFGEPSNGVNTQYAKLQTAISNVAASPDSKAVRQTVLTQAQTFATALNSAGAAIVAQKASVIAQSTSIVQQANTLINQIATLNGQIRALSAAGDNANTYLDQRDYAVDKLSQIVQTTTTVQANGSALVSVAGRPLVSDTVAYDLAIPVVTISSNGTPTLVVGLAGDANPSNPSPIPLGTGQLGAYTDLYNNKLEPYAQQLDNFASSAANEMNRISEAGVDLNGNAGAALFTTAAGQTSITAATIGAGISDPTQLAVGLISTSAGTLTQAMNSANNTVSTSVAIDGNATLFNPPAAALAGTLTIAVDGTSQTFAYNTGAGGSAATIGDFTTNFNNGKYGVSASFDVTTQKIVFTRDPNNVDVVHRAKQGAGATTAGFTITDSLTATSPANQGTPGTSLLQALGATNMNGVAQTPLNAYGSADNGAANALLKLFTQNVGVGALQTTASAVSAAGAGSITITQPAGTPGPFSTVSVGQSLTIVNPATGATQVVPVTAVNRATGTITVTATATINVGDAITTTPQQTLSGAYQGLITQMGLDVSTAKTGLSTQSALASSIDQARQSVSGINIDEETQNLLKFQNAYSAAAKTLSTLNAMMQQTLGLIAGG